MIFLQMEDKFMNTNTKSIRYAPFPENFLYERRNAILM